MSTRRVSSICWWSGLAGSEPLRAAGPDDLARLLPMVAEFHAGFGLATSAAARRAALAGLLAEPDRGRAFLIGEAEAVGYLALDFGWSLELGRRTGFLDELFVAPQARGAGHARRALAALPQALAGLDLRALFLEVDRRDTRTQRLYTQAGFSLRDRYCLMARPLGD